MKRELARALAFVLRSQFHPGPTHLFADPVAVRGAVPGSPSIGSSGSTTRSTPAA